MILRPWHERDASALVTLADNRRIAAQMRDRFPHPYTRGDAEAWLALAGASPSRIFAIECDGALAGSIAFIPGTDIERCSAEVGYWVGEPFWGRGIATAALGMLIERVAVQGAITRLFALPFATNEASRRVLEKAGFTLDAVLRRSAIKEGRIVDQCLYSLVLPEPSLIV